MLLCVLLAAMKKSSAKRKTNKLVDPGRPLCECVSVKFKCCEELQYTACERILDVCVNIPIPF